jgi:hypothetical protein
MRNDGQNSNGRFLIKALVIAALAASICLNACATVRQNAIPPPPPTAKLRVFVQVISEEPRDRRQHYGIPPIEWERVMTAVVDRYLQATGVYEVVSKEDTQAVLGTRAPASEQYWWVKKDYALLREAGKALYADYAIIIIRTFLTDITYKMVLINIETGAQYTASDSLLITRTSIDLNIKRGKILVQNLYRKLFYNAKGDLLATAIRKGRLMPEKETKKPAPGAGPTLPIEPPKAKGPVEESVLPLPSGAKLPDTIIKKHVPDMKKDKDIPTAAARIAPAPQPLLPTADKRKEFEKKLEHDLQTETPATDKAKLVVYDFDTVERLSVVALILTDALREELFILGRFLLVNRENVMQVMEELKLQHSGLVDEKEIVELGKWLAANQAVTGRLAMLGNSYVLQAKRMDIKTMGTLGLGTLRCSSGQEEELLSGIPVLARKLIGMKMSVP